MEVGSGRIEMSTEGVRMKVGSRLTMLLSYEGELKLGSLVIGRDSSGDMLLEVCKQLGVPKKQYIQVGSDSDKGIHLQVTETECLTQLGSFGIMQNKDRVLYGNIEDDEFVKSAAVYDKKASKWAIEKDGAIIEVDATKALSSINRIIKEACIEVMGNSNISKPSYMNDEMQGRPIDIAPSPLLHFPPSFFCSTVDSESTNLAEKLLEVDRLLIDSLKDDRRIDRRLTTESFGRQPTITLTEEAERPADGTNKGKGQRNSQTESGINFQFKKQRKPKTVFSMSKAKVANGKRQSVLGRTEEELTKDQTVSDRFKSTVDTSDKQRLANLSEERESQITDGRKSLTSVNKNAQGVIYKAGQQVEAVKVRSFLQGKATDGQSKATFNTQFEVAIQGPDLKKQASEPKLTKLPQDSQSRRSGSVASSVRSLKRPLSTSTNKERLSHNSTESTKKEKSKPISTSYKKERANTQGNRLPSTTAKKGLSRGSSQVSHEVQPRSELLEPDHKITEGVSDLVRKMETKIDDLVKDIIGMNANEFKHFKKPVEPLSTPVKEKSGKKSKDRATVETTITVTSPQFGSPIDDQNLLEIPETSRASSIRSSLRSAGHGLSTLEAKQAQLSQSPLSVKSGRPRSTVAFEQKVIECLQAVCHEDYIHFTLPPKMPSPEPSYNRSDRMSQKTDKSLRSIPDSKVDDGRVSMATTSVARPSTKQIGADGGKPAKTNEKPTKANDNQQRHKILRKTGSSLSEVSQELDIYSVGLGRLKINKESPEIAVQFERFTDMPDKEKINLQITTAKTKGALTKESKPAKISKTKVNQPILAKMIPEPAISTPVLTKTNPEPVADLDTSQDQIGDSQIQYARIDDLQKRAKEVLDKYRSPSIKIAADVKKSVKWSEAVQVKEITPLPDRKRSKTVDDNHGRRFNFVDTAAIDQHLMELGVEKSTTPVQARMAIDSVGLSVKPLHSDKWHRVAFDCLPIHSNTIIYRFWLAMGGIGLISASDRFACILNVYPHELFVMLDTIVRG